MNIRHWNVLSWNVRGINFDKTWDAVRDRILNSACDIVCLQETKRENFDLQFIRKICPPYFDQFVFLPSAGGIIAIIWNQLSF